MTNEIQIPSEFVSLFSNKDFVETVKVLSLYLAKENKEYREEMTAALIPNLDELIQNKINESYTSPEFEAALDTELSTLDIFCNIPRRILDLEYAVGIRECDPEEIEDHAVPERILNIEAKINNGVVGTSESSPIEISPETKTELRASCLVKALEASEKKYFSAAEIIDFLKCKLPDSCKIDQNVKNIRKVKQDVVSKAVEMFSSIVEPNRKTTGHKDIRLVLKS